MPATVLNVDPSAPYASYIAPLREAARRLAEGEVALFATDTVHAIGADSTRSGAVARVAAIKGRDPAKPIAMLVHSAAEAAKRSGAFPPVARRAAAMFWPGAFTLVLPGRDGESQGFRVPAARVASDLARELGRPVAATSANRSGQEPIADFSRAAEEFRDEVDLIIESGTVPSGAASTVARPQGWHLEVLREGAVPRDALTPLEGLRALFLCTGNSCRSPMAEALARKRAAELLGLPEAELPGRGLVFFSAGTATLGRSPAHPNAQEAVAELGASLADHRTRPLTPSDVEQSDVVYAMTKAHRELVNAWVPEARDRVRLLDPEGRDVPDPIGEPVARYRECARRIQAALEPAVRELVERLQAG